MNRSETGQPETGHPAVSRPDRTVEIMQRKLPASSQFLLGDFRRSAQMGKVRGAPLHVVRFARVHCDSCYSQLYLSA